MNRRRVVFVTATAVGAGFIFLVSLMSPVEMVESDPALMLVAAQAVIDHHTVRLDGYRDHSACSYDLENDYRVFRQGDSLYYYSTGAAVISLPAVLAANVFGLHMLNQDHEFIVQNLVSALLTAFIFVLLIRLGRVVVEPWPVFLIALITVLGSSLISTLATGLWNSCYQSILICVALILVVRHEGRKKPWYLLGVAGALVLAFLIRPSTAFLILAVGLAGRDIPKRWQVLGLICAVVAVIIAFFVFGSGEGVARYYSPRKILPQTSLLTGLHGTMISPSRGLLVFSPFIAVVLVSVLALARKVFAQPGARIVSVWIVLHILAVSTRTVWWGGHCFGPRLMTDVMPGFALLACCAWRSMETRRRWLPAALFLALGVPAVFFNSYQGLFNPHTKIWSSDPNVDSNVSLIFDWRYPQFLATEEQIDRRRFELRRASLGFTEVGSEHAYDSSNLAFSSWYGAEGTWRWSRGSRAQVLLKLGAFDRWDAHLLEIRAGALGHQQVAVEVNGRDIGAIELDGFDPQTRLLVIPPLVLRPGGENRVTFGISGAAPTAGDPRLLGIAFRSLAFSRFPTGPPHVGFEDDELFVAGFSSPEDGWRWSDGNRAQLVCPVARVSPEVNHVLELVGGTLGRQSASVHLDGNRIGTIELSGHHPQRFLLPVPAGLLASYRLHEIEFELPDACQAPGDDRELGLAFVSLTLIQESHSHDEDFGTAVRWSQ